MRRTGYNDQRDGLYWMLTDHLGSTTAIVKGYDVSPNGTTYERTLYMPWGERRGSGQVTVTSVNFTGQRVENALGLHYFRARWLDSYLNRWTSPDIIIPDPNDPQSYDRYSYVRNNPVNRVDPSGHADQCSDCGGASLEQTLEYFKKYGKHKGLFNDYYATVYFAEEVFADAVSDGVIDEQETVLLTTYEKAKDDAYNLAVGNVRQSDFTPSMLNDSPTLFAQRATELGIKADYTLLAVGGISVVVIFKHGARHLIPLGLSQVEVEAVIQQEIAAIVQSSSYPPGAFFGRITINGTVIEYHAFPYNNSYYVGTYYEPRDK
jgi:RHS repeat-associated protein